MEFPAALPPDPSTQEDRRVHALQALGILDTPAEALLDALTRSAAAACGMPVAVLNLLDRRRQWTKSQVGLPGAGDIPREESICTLVVESGRYLEIPDTRADARVSAKPCVREAPALLFYAGAPLVAPDGAVVGTLAVLDHHPRPGLAPQQRLALQELARAAMQALLLRQAAHRSVQSSSEQMFRELSEMAPVGIFHTDARGRVIYLNPQSTRIFGRTQEQLLGDDWVRSVHPEDAPRVVARWQRAAAAAQMFEQTYRVRRGDGSLVHVRVRAQAVRLPDGSAGGYVGTLEDVTDSERARVALERSQERLHRAMEASGLALWDLDVPGEAVYLSEHWSVMLGGAPRETRCTAQELLELVPVEDLPAIQSALEPVLDGRSPTYSVQHRVRRQDGSLLWIHSEGRVADRQAGGAPLRMVGTNRDITASRQAERDLREARDAADAANRAKTQFLATMSHEIRTPLNGIIGVTRLLLDEELAPAVRRHAELVDRSAHSLLSLVNDILDVSKIEAGQMEIESVSFDLHELVEDLVNLYRLRASEKSLLFRVRIDPAVPRHVQADPTRLRQVLVNLLGNALKFTSKGWIGLDVRGRRGEADHALEFVVTDTGVGIPADVLPHLFTRFMQADSSTSRRFGGTGLGLSIVRQLVGLMGGTVSVASEPGRGSRFTVAVPVGDAEEAPAATVWQDLPPSSQPARILVAEDNPTNQVVASGMLRKLGYEDVSIANDGAEAVAMAAREDFDLVLMDCQMPEMDGYEATRRLRAAGFAAPIVAMTANAIKGDRERCIEAGMNDYLTKPMDLRLLRGMLARWGGGAPSRLSDLPLFDADAMQARFGGDRELEEVALSTFEQATPRLLEKLQAALDAGDRPAFERHAHSAKGSSAMISAERCAALGALMEERAQAAPPEELRQLVEEFRRAFEDFLGVLRAR